MSDTLATPSIHVTRLRGKRTYLKDGKLHADRVGEGRQIAVDSFERVLQTICPCCQGLGATPGGDSVTEGEVFEIIRGGHKYNEDGEIMELKTCRRCEGDGVVCDESDPREDAADVEYHLAIER